MTIQWLSLADAANHLPEADYTHLADNGSLTRRVRGRCPDSFEVKLIHHRIALPGMQERAILNLPEQGEVISRQVFLCCRQRARIFAHTIIGLTPENRKLTDRISALGAHSLGSILFRDPLAKKIAMHLACVPGDDDFFADAGLSARQKHQKIWVRRNLYSYEGCDLLVYEAYIDFSRSETFI